MSESFFDRWSRRKKEAREEVSARPVAEEAEKPAGAGVSDGNPAAGVARVAPVETAAPVAAPEHARTGLATDAQDAVPPPTLADAQALTPESDFRPFVGRNVAPEVKNTAFKKLFADPQFNVMDGMDTYIDDYSQSTPIPGNVLRQMASAKFLKLFDDEDEEKNAQETAGESREQPAQDAAPTGVAQSPCPEDPLPSQQAAIAQPASQKTDDHNADMRLQPDDAARAEDARRGAG
jgi:hypothetical protein